MQCLDLLQQIGRASGTRFEAIELENAFFSTPTRKEGIKPVCCHLEQREIYIHSHVLWAMLTSVLYVTTEFYRILIIG